ncbi:RloB family protein [Neolewinella agarilytica]|uniref:RloB family protein n=1 Tax=Neolewinella agarilytica TaxID=478744 RepID=UPI0023577100|nr:RloB family protein [Neolewinella agarilytica]
MGRGKQRRTRFALLIVCEGEQTEKHYFQSFKSDKLHLDVRPYVGQPRQIVLRAESLMARKSYDEVWVVFDLDYDASRGSEQYQEFEKAIKLAKEKGCEVAYTIDAFELWFRLHYERITSSLDRKALYKDLSKRWSINYEKDGKRADFAKAIPQRLSADEAADVMKAIDRAKAMFHKRGGLPLVDRNPITTVHLLVERLLSFQD